MRGTISLTPAAVTHGIIWMLALAAAGASTAQTTATKPAGLRIVVIAGEDAVNVIQQKTAVAPMVEFSGALSAGAITGTLTITNRTVPTNPNLLPGGALGGNAFGGSGSASYPMTLR